MRILFVVLLLALALSSAGQTLVKAADSIRRIRGIPCMGYAVFTADKILDMGVAGYRKYRTRDSARVTDRFYIGTNTFAFTSYIAAKLVEAGKIKWTTTYLELFPQNKSKVLAEFHGVALKDLLSNQSGLAPYNNINDFAFVPFFPNDIVSQRRDFSLWLLQRPGLGADRKNKMVISVVGYGVAATMLEKVSGMSWEKMLEEYINKPMGIAARTGYPNKISEQQPWGHWARYGPLTPEPPDTWVKVYPPIIPGIDINITIADYARFLQEHLRGLKGEKAGLTKRTFDLLHFGMPDYSLGWQNAAIGNDRISYHTGESQLFMTYVELIPEKNIGILVMGNNGESTGKGAALNLCRELRDYYMR